VGKRVTGSRKPRKKKMQKRSADERRDFAFIKKGGRFVCVGSKEKDRKTSRKSHICASSQKEKERVASGEIRGDQKGKQRIGGKRERGALRLHTSGKKKSTTDIGKVRGAPVGTAVKTGGCSPQTSWTEGMGGSEPHILENLEKGREGISSHHPTKRTKRV